MSKPIAIYLRVSSEEQAAHGYSLAHQEDACRARAANIDKYADVVVFRDEGISGSLLSRPALDRLLSQARNGSLQSVVMWDPDRLARNLGHQLVITQELDRLGICLEFVNFDWNRTPEGQLFYAMRGAISQYEREKIRQRTSTGRKQKAKQGQLPMKFEPYGYTYNPELSALDINPGEAVYVRKMFEMVADGKSGVTAIAKWLNASGIPTKRGARNWSHQVIRQILSNEVYTGVLYTNRFDTKDLGLNKHLPKEKRAKQTERPREEWIPVEVPSIISRDTFATVQERLKETFEKWLNRRRGDYPLSGLLMCGECGFSMYGVLANEWGKTKRKYTCRKAYPAAVAGACKNHHVNADCLDEIVWDQIRRWLDNPATFEQALHDTGQRSSAVDELGVVQRELVDALQGQAHMLEFVKRAKPSKVLTMDQMLDHYNDTVKRVEVLEKRREALLQSLEEDPSLQMTVLWSQFQDWLATSGDPETRKRIARLLIQEIVIRGQSITIYARIPGNESPHPTNKTGKDNRPGDGMRNEILMHLRATKRTRGEVSLYDPVGVDREGNEICLMSVI